jgi:glycosyltransferase involved in cell wall biosynthesis
MTRVHKDRLVVGVGRFNPDKRSNNKKQEILIEAWTQLAPRLEPDGWQLHLVGGLGEDQASRDYIARLRSEAAGLAVRFHPNMDWAALADLYRRSTLFWHATGYGETQPERFEHFGITTVEAMAHGCVPIVFAAGGQLDIVQNGKDGRLWRSVDELVAVTEALVARPDELLRMSAAGRVTAAAFGKEHFLQRIRESVLRPAGIGV